ncbi:hypothetical protein Btru_043812 [Bulinus truncatus]|nr:hypothetical protein Btru_043812 [Bulinus truncatus]
MNVYRWFHVHENATMELQLMYDSYFEVLRWLLIYSMKEIEIKLSPDDCFQSLSTDEQDNLTRHFLVHEFQLPNFKMCSTHIGDHEGEGRLVFRCCQPTSDVEMACFDIQEDDLLFKLHVFSIIVTVFILLYIASKFVFMYTRAEEFDFHPKGLKLDLTTERTEDFDFYPKELCCSKDGLRLKITGDGQHDINLTEKEIKNLPSLYQVYKEYNWTKLLKKRYRIGALILLLVLFACLTPIICLYCVTDKDYIELCHAYEQRHLKCQFYMIANNHILTVIIVASVLYVISIVAYLILTLCLKFDHPLARKVVHLLIITLMFLTWGVFIHFFVYFIGRWILTSAITKNVYDDMSLVVPPTIYLFTQNVTSVSRKYQCITKSIIQHLSSKVGHGNHSDYNKKAVLIKEDEIYRPSIIIKRNKLQLELRRPLIFIKSSRDVLISTNLVWKLSESGSKDVIRSYGKAAGLALLPCVVFVLVFLFAVMYGSLYSYSSELPAYIAFFVPIYGMIRNLVLEPAFTPSDANIAHVIRFPADLETAYEKYLERWGVVDIFCDKSNIEESAESQEIQIVSQKKSNSRESAESEEMQIISSHQV